MIQRMTTEEKGYKRLRMWQEAHKLTLLTYRITKQFPKDELFALTSQIRRATVSIAANIVEGQARISKREFLQFLSIANGSLVEVEYYIQLSKDLGYITENQQKELEHQLHYVGVLLHKYMFTMKQ